MTRLFGPLLPFLSAVVLISPASAMEPLQYSQAGSSDMPSGAKALDLATEQAHFSDPSKRLGQVDNTSYLPLAPDEKGRPPSGYSVLDLNF